MSPGLRPLLLLPALLALAGCDLLGIETLSQQQARRTAEGKAIGSACRHAGRAIEDCYTLNKKSDRAAIFAGWREMNEYMVENKLEPVVPVIPPEPPKPPKVAKAAASKPAESEGDGEAEATASAKH